MILRRSLIALSSFFSRPLFFFKTLFELWLHQDWKKISLSNCHSAITNYTVAFIITLSTGETVKARNECLFILTQTLWTSPVLAPLQYPTLAVNFSPRADSSLYKGQTSSSTWCEQLLNLPRASLEGYNSQRHQVVYLQPHSSQTRPSQ